MGLPVGPDWLDLKRVPGYVLWTTVAGLAAGLVVLVVSAWFGGSGSINPQATRAPAQVAPGDGPAETTPQDEGVGLGVSPPAADTPEPDSTPSRPVEQQVASTVSLPGPQPGETRRSSDPFQGDDVPDGAVAFRWEFDGADPGTTVNIRRDFRILEDGLGGDETLFEVRDEAVTPVVGPMPELYVADVKGATDSFVVRVYAVISDSP